MDADRPTLHVTNWASRKLHGPGRRWTVMRNPRKWEHGDGNVPALTPSARSLAAVRAGEIGIDEYRRIYLAGTDVYAVEPGNLRAYGRETADVADGDTLCCACSRAAAARGECHRAWAAAALAAAGWRVLLDGEEVPRVG